MLSSKKCSKKFCEYVSSHEDYNVTVVDLTISYYVFEHIHNIIFRGIMKVCGI